MCKNTLYKMRSKSKWNFPKVFLVVDNLPTEPKKTSDARQKCGNLRYTP